MAPEATYVFLDLETTGIPKEEFNKTKITQLSMVAVKRSHLLDTQAGLAPRVKQKLSLCLNPGRMIQPGSTEVTGLSNELLEHETTFNMKVFNMINVFLSVLTEPVYLIAQNGLNFDFPILKTHLNKLNVSLPDHILCADSLHSFYDIMEKKKRQDNLEYAEIHRNISPTESRAARTEPFENKEQNLKKQISVNNRIVAENASLIELPTEDTDLKVEDTLSVQSINERTPMKPTKQHVTGAPRKQKVIRNTISKVRRRFPWSGGEKPTEKYKLKDIYRRLLNREARDAHDAEVDCMLALECAVVLNKEFVEWVDENNCPFAEIKPMTVGVPIGQ